MIKVINNALPEALFTKLQTIIMEGNIQYSFKQSIAYAAENSPSLFDYGFEHTTADIQDAFIVGFLDACATELTALVGMPVAVITRIRIGLLTNVNQPHTHAAHVDMPYPHYTALLYLNATDGDTVLYNEKYDYGSGLDHKTYSEQPGFALTERIRVCPEPNKLVIFEGNIYHASSSPTLTAARYAININFTVKQ